MKKYGFHMGRNLSTNDSLEGIRKVMKMDRFHHCYKQEQVVVFAAPVSGTDSRLC